MKTYVYLFAENAGNYNNAVSNVYRQKQENKFQIRFRHSKT